MILEKCIPETWYLRNHKTINTITYSSILKQYIKYINIIFNSIFPYLRFMKRQNVTREVKVDVFYEEFQRDVCLVL